MNTNATASWSGYSHQGKIGLLIALRKINALFDPLLDLTPFILAYETQEDVKISKGIVPIEVHQVKALTGTTTISGYTEALFKFKGCEGGNYLHTVNEITNWDSLDALQNPSSVGRYIYSPGIDFCPLSGLNKYIDDEIQTFLQKVGHEESENPGWRQNVFQEFQFELDERIRFEHQNHNQNSYNIAFNLEEVTEILCRPPVKFNSKLHFIRRKMFEQYELFISCSSDCGMVMEAAHQQKIIAFIRRIYELPNIQFVQFLRNINPHTTADKKIDAIEGIEDFFIAQNFYETFINTLINATGSECTIDLQTIPNYFKQGSYLLTSIQSIENRKGHHARAILNNQQINFSRYESDFLISQSYSGSLMDCASKLITKDPNKFFHCKNMSFISMEKATLQLNS